MFAYRGSGNGRIPDLVDAIKNEYETLQQELHLTKLQRDEYERKLQIQVQELQSIQNSLFELERNHARFRQKYEEDLFNLKRIAGDKDTSMLGGASNTHTIPSLSNLENLVNKSTVNSGMNGHNLAPSPTPKGEPTSLLPPAASASMMMKRPREDLQKIAPSNKNSVSPATSNDISLSSMMNEHPQKKLAGPKSEGQMGDKLPSFSELGKKDTDAKRDESDDRDDDWVVAYNPTLSTNIHTELGFTMEVNSVVCCVKFSHDGKYVATGCNRAAHIFDVETGQKAHLLSDHGNTDADLYVRSISFSPSGKHLATGAEDKTVKIWDIEKETVSQTFLGHQLDIYSLDFTYDGRYVVSGSGDRRAKIWDMETGKCLFTLGNEEVGPKDGITSVAYSPDGRLVAAASLDRIIRIWDAQTGFYLERFEGHMDSVYSVAFSPDGNTLASGSLDRTLKLWDRHGNRSRSRCRSTFNGHKDYVLSVAFSPTGDWLVSGSKDRSVQFWDPRTAVSHMMLQGHKNSVISVAMNPNNTSFATGSGDHRARLWKFSQTSPNE